MQACSSRLPEAMQYMQNQGLADIQCIVRPANLILLAWGKSPLHVTNDQWQKMVWCLVSAEKKEKLRFLQVLAVWSLPWLGYKVLIAAIHPVFEHSCSPFASALSRQDISLLHWAMSSLHTRHRRSGVKLCKRFFLAGCVKCSHAFC